MNNIHKFILYKKKLYAKKLSEESKPMSLSNFLQTKIGNITNQNNTMQDLYNAEQKGLILRMAFDDMKQDVVPGTIIYITTQW